MIARRAGLRGLRPAAFALAALALSGCLAADMAVQETTRGMAKGVVNQVMRERFPGVDAAPYTDCIIDSASTGEIITIARAASTGLTPETAALVLDIARRPEALRCMAAQPGLAALIGGTI